MGADRHGGEDQGVAELVLLEREQAGCTGVATGIWWVSTHIDLNAISLLFGWLALERGIRCLGGVAR